MKTLQRLVKAGGVLLFTGVISASVNLGATEQPPQNNLVADAGASLVRCNTPRPEICYEVYQPVCAVRDTSVRCVTTPCPSTEKMTYPNDCKACSDATVHGFQRGDCNSINTTGLESRLERLIKG
ncbi:MAG: Unknown protein [uncultured Thiotrichaceae bacterium]|uniref:Kazal-like domain-containing protein n=1 Tax=uncultured Thiotrichaceae bacterium TaxID=298394 RepID=A0A6S6SZ10_9GAMM|nr:MAG: Unknown protein [uncultured Thiotrichaceae bacterium]